jgi:hypothetical protein
MLLTPSFRQMQKLKHSGKKSLVSRTINSQWRTRPDFVTFGRTGDPDISIWPEESKYYLEEKAGMYHL